VIHAVRLPCHDIAFENEVAVGKSKPGNARSEPVVDIETGSVRSNERIRLSRTENRDILRYVDG
jgi:hypothetical protein